MYARVARFEGIHAETIDEQVADIKRQMAAASAGEIPEGAPAELQTLIDGIVRFVQLVDRENGTAYGIAFCETEEDVQRVHEALDAMSPNDGEGKRTSVGIYEVAIDHDV